METEVKNPSPTLPAIDDYPPIDGYALIGDCRTAALISRDGSIDWLCWPHFSSPSLFAALLDHRRGGHFAVRPVNHYTVTRRYVGPTAVLETIFHTTTGALRVTDSMPIMRCGRTADTLEPERELLRRIDVLQGNVEIDIQYVPRPDYARRLPRLRSRGALGWMCLDRNSAVNLHSDIKLAATPDQSGLQARITLTQGERRYLSLCFVDSDIAVIAPLGAHAEKRLQATLEWWVQWANDCRYRGRYRDVVIRSAITLKLMTYHLSGAVVAAPTTSLPEAVGGIRNWDYRYCWLRDASFVIDAFMDLGYLLEANAFLGWLLHATALTRPQLQVMYGIYGENKLTERTLDHLEGYRHSRPVRIGNGAHDQLQLDTHGNVVLAACEFVERGGRLQREEVRLLRQLGETVCATWQQPDHGIWEIRGGPRHHTYSKLMCWVALDRLLHLHESGHIRVPVDKFKTERAAIARAIETRGYNPALGAYSGFFDEAVPDASLLLMPRHGFCAADDPRMRATFACIERALGDGPLHYRLPRGADRLPGDEGAFLITSFWSVEYLARSGEPERARERFERLLDYMNDVGLYGEEVDVASGQALGNFPQAFSHVGLILAALCVDASAELQERRA